nr:M23 family metallopeptidase [Streptomyces sp. SID3343]
MKGLRPRRPILVVAGLAVVAAATTAGVQASGAGAGAGAAHGHRVMGLAPSSGSASESADPDAARLLSERGEDVAARGNERDPLEVRQEAEAAEAKASADAQAAAEAEAEAEAEAAREQAAAKAEAAAKGWVLPTSGYSLTGRFGKAGARWASTHTGLDFATPSGTPIKAAAAGRITSAGGAGAFGNRIVITHTDGTQTWYCHQSRFAKTSGSVAAGDVIGYVGTTGNSTGPHLHFEVHPGGGSAVDPAGWLRAKGVSP